MSGVELASLGLLLSPQVGTRVLFSCFSLHFAFVALLSFYPALTVTCVHVLFMLPTIPQIAGDKDYNFLIFFSPTVLAYLDSSGIQ